MLCYNGITSVFETPQLRGHISAGIERGIIALKGTNVANRHLGGQSEAAWTSEASGHLYRKLFGYFGFFESASLTTLCPFSMPSSLTISSFTTSPSWLKESWGSWSRWWVFERVQQCIALAAAQVGVRLASAVGDTVERQQSVPGEHLGAEVTHKGLEASVGLDVGAQAAV